MLQQKIKNELKDAMRVKNATRVTVLRAMLAAFVNELISKRRKPDETLSDEEALAVIKRLARQRQEAISQFTIGDRGDLAEQERVELTVLEEYLPAQMPQEEIKKTAEAKMADLGLREKADAGKLIGAVMKELKGRADGAEVKAVVEKLLFG